MVYFESIAALVFCIASVSSTPIEDGQWHPSKYGDTGKYIPTDEGKYIHVPNPYIHIDNPYVHDYEPYVQEASVYKLVKVPPEHPNPFYKPGYYQNNGLKIISQNHNYEEDKYDFDFETENKIRAEEKAVLKNPNSIDEGIASEGFYEYIGPDGFMYRVDYTADENGFRPKVKRLSTKYSGKWVLERIN